jgi:dephospho-CoA kinase
MASSNNIYFDELKNITLDSVVKIFSKGKDISELKPHNDNPTIMILAGSPGVGKTTSAKKLIPQILGDKYKYDNFYNISLDSLVERVKPYREVTHSLYKEITKYKGKLNNNNTALLSTIYLNTIMSTSQNFNLGNTRKKVISKIRGYNIHRNKTIRNKDILSLNKWRNQGLDYAIKNGLNILYDTTLQPKTDVIKRDIVPLLHKYTKNEHTNKYTVIIVLVEADEETIKERIRGRHKSMLEEKTPYIRAVSIPIVKQFIEMNEEGFNKALKDYNNNDYITHGTNNSKYNSSDFTFYKVQNIKNKEPIIEKVISPDTNNL